MSTIFGREDDDASGELNKEEGRIAKRNFSGEIQKASMIRDMMKKVNMDCSKMIYSIVGYKNALVRGEMDRQAVVDALEVAESIEEMAGSICEELMDAWEGTHVDKAQVVKKKGTKRAERREAYTRAREFQGQLKARKERAQKGKSGDSRRGVDQNARGG